MPSSPLTTEEPKPGLTTVAGVVAEINKAFAGYEAKRKALLTAWQAERKHLRALLAVLKDKEGWTQSPADLDSDKDEK